MAEGFARSRGINAGSMPSSHINPLAVKVLSPNTFELTFKGLLDNNKENLHG